MNYIRHIVVLFLALISTAVWGQTVSGTVTDENNQPLPGATVVVQGTNRGTSTDFDGKYQINATQGETLVFSYVGYATQEIIAKGGGNSLTINALLQPDNTLDEVVVTAYGTQTKKSLTGSVGIVSSDAIEIVRNPNVVQGVTGKVAGVQVINDSGQPGEEPTVRVRGLGSLYSEAGPLYVVDGVPFNGDISSISNNDIASMTILKDAAAGALYGHRGANGVVIITTKKGKKGEIKVNLDISTSMSTRGGPEYDVITDPGRFYEAYYQASRNYLYTSGYSLADASQIAADNLIIDNDGLGFSLGYNIYGGDDTKVIDPTTGKVRSGNYLWNESWEDYLFSPKISTKTFLSVAGGGENSKAYFSVNHEENEGYALASDFTKTSVKVSAEFDISQSLRAGGSINYANTIQNRVDQGGNYSGLFQWSRTIAPIYPVFGYELDGTPILNSTGSHVYDYGNGHTGTPQTRPFGDFQNPVATAQLDIKKNTRENISARTFIDFDLSKDFNFKYNIGVDLVSGHDVNYDTSLGGDAAGAGGRSNPDSSREYTVTEQQLLTWKKSFNDHDFEVMVGHETAKRHFVYLSAEKTNLLLPEETVLDFGVVMEDMDNFETDYSVEGYLSRFKYNFKDKYFIDANFRRDASSVFHPDSRWGNFWGAGVAWRISEESFLENVDWISNLKLKGSVGTQGNDAIFYSGSFTVRNYLPYQNQYEVSNNNGSFGINLRYSGGGKELTWEVSKNFNAGFELGLLDGRFSVDFEYFKREIDNLLFNLPQSPSSGIPDIPSNAGTMENSGYEFTIDAGIIKKEDFSINFVLNATTVDNKITALPLDGKGVPKDDIDYFNGRTRLNVGKSAFEYHTYEFAGVNPNNGASLFWKDVLNKDGDPTGDREIIESFVGADQYYVGKSALADWFGGFGTNIRYKNSGFAMNFAYQIGGYGWDSSYIGLLTPEDGGNYHKDIFDKTWTPENTGAELPAVLRNDELNYYAGSLNLVDASYLSLQDISLWHDFNNLAAFDKIGVEQVRLYASATNVFVWSKRKGFDPRLNFTGYNDQADYSLMRTISLGVRANF